VTGNGGVCQACEYFSILGRTCELWQIYLVRNPPPSLLETWRALAHKVRVPEICPLAGPVVTTIQLRTVRRSLNTMRQDVGACNAGDNKGPGDGSGEWLVQWSSEDPRGHSAARSAQQTSAQIRRAYSGNCDRRGKSRSPRTRTARASTTRAQSSGPGRGRFLSAGDDNEWPVWEFSGRNTSSIQQHNQPCAHGPSGASRALSCTRKTRPLDVLARTTLGDCTKPPHSSCSTKPGAELRHRPESDRPTVNNPPPVSVAFNVGRGQQPFLPLVIQIVADADRSGTR